MVYFACAGCGKSLLLAEHVNEHEAGEGQTSFKWRKRDAAVVTAQRDDSICTSYFVDRMGWMGEMDANEGRVCCPKCKAKLGKYFWSGTQCSCGAWVTPAIQISKAKVDCKTIAS